MDDPTLVFLPGMGADHRLFKYQTATFPNCYAADWIDSLPNESLEQYAVRLAETIITADEDVRKYNVPWVW